MGGVKGHRSVGRIGGPETDSEIESTDVWEKSKGNPGEERAEVGLGLAHMPKMNLFTGLMPPQT